MSAKPEILVHTEAAVMTITINRVEKKNSLTAAMYGSLADALDSAARDAAVRVVVIQGHELIFSAGNDINDFLSMFDLFILLSVGCSFEITLFDI